MTTFEFRLLLVVGSFLLMADGFQQVPLRSVNTLRRESFLKTTSEQVPFFGTAVKESSSKQTITTSKRRELGSQENLMLPRQYGYNKDVTFPQMNHVSCTILSATPSEQHLSTAIDAVMKAHPLLNSRIEGDGEPEKRIDLFNMVRSGDPNPCTFVSTPGQFSSADVLNVKEVTGKNRGDLDQSWKASFQSDLDDGSWCDVSDSPLWKVELHRQRDNKDGPCALLFSFNHAISDQSTASKLTDQILFLLAQLDDTGIISQFPKEQEIPVSVEESVLGAGRRFADIQTEDFNTGTVGYVAGKALEDARGPVIMPEGAEQGGGILGALTTISGNAAGGDDKSSSDRQSALAFRSLSKETSAALLKKCRENGVSISNALSAAVTLTGSDFISENEGSEKERTYKVLQSLDMRRFGASLDDGKSVGCLAGSMDLMHGPIEDNSGSKLRTSPTPNRLGAFWELAKEGRSQTEQFVRADGPKNAVRVFDFAMTISDMNNLVHLTAQSKSSQGRAYSAGFTNAGVYERMPAFEADGVIGEQIIKLKHGRYSVEDVFYAASNARTGTLFRFSCMTVDGEMKFTFHPATPIVDPSDNEEFADSLLQLLEVVAGVSVPTTDEEESLLSTIPKGLLVKTTAALGLFSVLSHAGGFFSFFQSVMEMKANATPVDFSAALNFWVFFAAGHPILEPILWISDVLHGTPGPMVGGLVPILFILGNVAAITLISVSAEVRNAVNVGVLFAFLSYVGAGLDGQAGLGDFNLALDDPYAGKVVKGCPAYDEVRQPSMNDFDLKKYQGLWYEHKFHDWTQFKEVYDTTLDIKLTADGKGWIDDFGVKGPSPNAAPLSWDKSPVANGAHYFLFGRVDENDPSGVLRESGFGVEFPNYIVDVKKDTATGEYKEAIQFQCLERGGVRVFEGINFMSRSPTMTDAEMAAMHGRAEAAGMYPYGASPEQMHLVERRPVDAPAVDNNWQEMWRFIGVDKLLELLTEAIEDGGR